MRKLIALEHISLDGYLAAPDGDMSWIHVDEELWEYVGPIINRCDTAVYGRVTYEMMAAYWPTAAEDPDATPHDIEHGQWTERATKLVFSSTLREAPWGASGSATLVSGDAAAAWHQIKQQPGGDMVLLGSASLVRSLIRDGLVDEYRVNVNPVMLGGGMSLFPEMAEPRRLKLEGVQRFASGVVGLHYTAVG